VIQTTGTADEVVKAALGHALSGDTILLGAGTFNESLDLEIDNITLLGAGANQSILLVSPNDEWYGIYVGSDNVTINGLTIDGANGVNDGNDDYLLAAADADNLKIINNSIINFSDSVVIGGDYGIYLWTTTGVNGTKALIEHNVFTGGDRAILLVNNGYADVMENSFSNVSVGLQSNNMWKASPDGKFTVSGNTIEASRYGIWDNLQYSNATSMLIEDNTISGARNVAKPSYGIYVTSIQGGVGANLVNNNVTGTDFGIGMWNVPSSLITITGGTLRNNLFGIKLDNDSYNSERGFALGTWETEGGNVSGVTIIDAEDHAFFVRDNPGVTPTSTSNMLNLLAQNVKVINSCIGLTSGIHTYLNISDSLFVNVPTRCSDIFNGEGNATIIDVDSDNVDDNIDNCPAVSNPDQADSNGNGIGNVCEPVVNFDNDYDGVQVFEDNCPTVSNTDQKDTDKDGIGDACDSTPKGVFKPLLVPVTGGAGSYSTFDCNSTTTLRLPSSDMVVASSDFCNMQGKLIEQFKEVLPAELPAGGPAFTFGMNLTVLDNLTPLTSITDPGRLTFSFSIPAYLRNKEFTILFWDPTLKLGAGDWVELPAYAEEEDGTPVITSLHVEEPSELRMTLEGVQKTEMNRVEFVTNFPGLFILAVK
jgi:hypothetical protein